MHKHSEELLDRRAKPSVLLAQLRAFRESANPLIGKATIQN
jgi:hypothetical protein